MRRRRSRKRQSRPWNTRTSTTWTFWRGTGRSGTCFGHLRATGLPFTMPQGGVLRPGRHLQPGIREGQGSGGVDGAGSGSGGGSGFEFLPGTGGSPDPFPLREARETLNAAGNDCVGCGRCGPEVEGRTSHARRSRGEPTRESQRGRDRVFRLRFDPVQVGSGAQDQGVTQHRG